MRIFIITLFLIACDRIEAQQEGTCTCDQLEPCVAQKELAKTACAFGSSCTQILSGEGLNGEAIMKCFEAKSLQKIEMRNCVEKKMGKRCVGTSLLRAKRHSSGGSRSRYQNAGFDGGRKNRRRGCPPPENLEKGFGRINIRKQLPEVFRQYRECIKECRKSFNPETFFQSAISGLEYYTKLEGLFRQKRQVRGRRGRSRGGHGFRGLRRGNIGQFPGESIGVNPDTGSNREGSGQRRRGRGGRRHKKSKPDHICARELSCELVEHDCDSLNQAKETCAAELGVQRGQKDLNLCHCLQSAGLSLDCTPESKE